MFNGLEREYILSTKQITFPISICTRNRSIINHINHIDSPNPNYKQIKENNRINNNATKNYIIRLTNGTDPVN